MLGCKGPFVICCVYCSHWRKQKEEADKELSVVRRELNAEVDKRKHLEVRLITAEKYIKEQQEKYSVLETKYNQSLPNSERIVNRDLEK